MKDLQEAVTGVDFITGDNLSDFERVTSGVCIYLPLVGGGTVRFVLKSDIVDAIKKTHHADDVAKAAGNLPKNIYNSIKEAPKYPKDFQAVKNGTTKNNISNQQLLDELKQVEAGKWQKVYKDGYSNGEKVSIHYFESPSGKVFDVDVTTGWSNPSSGR